MVKDPGLSLLCRQFDSWPGNFCQGCAPTSPTKKNLPAVQDTVCLEISPLVQWGQRNCHEANEA